MASSVCSVFDQAQILEKQGDYAQALSLYNSLLDHDLLNPVYNKKIGQMLLMINRYEESLYFFQKSIDKDPNQFEVYEYAFYSLKHLGKFHKAVECLEIALRLRPDCVDYYCSLISIYQEMGMLEEACNVCDKALSVNLENDKIFSRKALTLYSMGLLEQAIAYAERCIVLNSKNYEGFFVRALILQRVNKDLEAIESYKLAISIKPDLDLLYINMSLSFQKLADEIKALDCLNLAIQVNPKSARAFLQRGLIYFKQDLLELSLQDFNTALQINANFFEALYNKAFIFQKQDKFHQAISLYKEALNLRNNSIEAHNNLSVCNACIKNYDDALDWLNKYLKIDPDCKITMWNKSLMLLLLGKYEEGWNLYKNRIFTSDWTEKNKALKEFIVSSEIPLVKALPKKGQKILIHSEQGFGDIIQFSRYAKMLSDLNVKVVFQVPKDLSKIMKSLDDKVDVITQTPDLDGFQAHVLLMDLPAIFETSLSNIKYAEGYLKVNQNDVKKWAKKIGKKKRKRIGFCFKGSKTHQSDLLRSIPLDIFCQFFDLPFDFYCLQKDLTEDEKIIMQRFKNVFIYSEEFIDFSETAALIQNLDIVISNDSAVAHLAGSINKECLLLLSYNPEFKWLDNTEDSLWYQSIKLIRQDQDKSWGKVIEKTINIVSS